MGFIHLYHVSKVGYITYSGNLNERIEEQHI